MTPPLLRVHWPRHLALPAHETAAQLLGERRYDETMQEVVVTAVSPAGAAAPPGLAAVGTLLLGSMATAEGFEQHSHGLLFGLQNNMTSGRLLPVLLLSQPAPPGCTCTQRRERQLRQRQQQPECQIVLYDRVSSLPQLCGPASSTQGAPVCGMYKSARRQLAARLASHLLGALLALAILVHSSELSAALVSAGSCLAQLATRQLLWLSGAQPAGVKLHSQLSELLGICGLQYIDAVQRLAAGRGITIGRGVAVLLAAAFAVGGPWRGLLLLRCLLWALALPSSLPYVAMAAVYGWQLRSTALMWRVMRGIQRLPLLRQLLVRNRGGGGAAAAATGVPPRSAGGGAAGPGNSAGAVASGDVDLSYLGMTPGSGLKQLSGSMLLFMPLLLLLPTTASFYALSLALHAACSLPRAAAALAAQLVSHNPATAATRQLLSAPCSDTMQYQVLDANFDPAALPAAARRAVQSTTYLVAQQQHGSPWRAACQAAASAWAACQFAPAGQILGAVLQGRPLWLAVAHLPPGFWEWPGL